LPDQAKEKPLQGIVVAVGPGSYTRTGELVPPQVKIGDMVIFNTFVGMEVEFEGHKYAMVNDNHLIGIIHSEASEIGSNIIQSMVDQGLQ